MKQRQATNMNISSNHYFQIAASNTGLCASPDYGSVDFPEKSNEALRVEKLYQRRGSYEILI